MTEEEAKTKWCPHAVASHTDPRAGFYGDDGRPKIFPYIGSACMAWRWQTEGWVLDFVDGEPIMRRPVSSNGLMGFCGLAGRP